MKPFFGILILAALAALLGSQCAGDPNHPMNFVLDTERREALR